MVKLNKVGAIRARELIKAGQINKVSSWDDPKVEDLDDHFHLGLDRDDSNAAVLPFGQVVSGRFLVFRAALVAIAEETAADEERYDERITDEALDLIELLDKTEASGDAGAESPAETEESDGGDDGGDDGGGGGKIPVENPPPGGAGKGKATDPREVPMTLGKMVRVGEFDIRTLNEKDRTVELSFSSEEPYLRWFGYEILGHEPGEIRMDRLNNSMALLSEHTSLRHIGAFVKAWLDKDKKLRGLVKFSRGELGEEKFQDVKDGILVHTSVGYIVHRMKLVEDNGGEEPDVYRVVDWECLEASLCAVPADITVGVGKNYGGGEFKAVVETRDADWAPPAYVETEQPATRTRSAGGGESMSDKTREAIAAADAAASAEAIAAERADEREKIKKQSAEIFQIAAKFKKAVPNAEDLARQAVGEGTSSRDFRTAILEELANRSGTPTSDVPTEIGMSDKERKSFNWLRAFCAMDPQATRAEKEAAKGEIEACEAAAKLFKHRTPTGMVFPMDVLRTKFPVPRRALRAMEAGNATLGGTLVGTEQMDFIELFTEKLVLSGVAQIFTGLTGNIAFPKETGHLAAHWVEELQAPGASDATTGSMAMRPKTIASKTIASKSLLKQVDSMDVEFWLKNRMAQRIARGAELAAIQGSGVGPEPEGILNTDGVGLVALGTNGAAPTWDLLVDLEAKVASYDADVGSGAYLSNTKVRGTLKKTKMDGTNLPFIWMPGQKELNGYPALTTNLMPSDLSKGTGTNLSAMIYGFFEHLYMGFWGPVEFIADPYTMAGERALVLHANQDADIGNAHPEAFAVCKDIITS